MGICNVFMDVFRYPFTDSNKFLSVILLSLGSFLIIPALMVYGYSLRVIKSTILGFDELPNFDDSGNLIADGLKLIAVNIIYNIPMYVVSFVFIMVAMGKSDLSFTSYSSQAIIAIVVFFISIVLVPAVANMAYEDKFRAAFDIKRVFKLIKNIGWIRYLSYLILYSVIVQILSLAVNLTSPHLKIYIGAIYWLIYYLLLLLLNSYLILIGGRFRGIIYSEGMQE